MRLTRAAPLLTALLLLGACGSGDAPGSLSADERRELNEAAEMLDANSVALEDVVDNSSGDD